MFNYYIVSVDGDIKGTNDIDIANEFAMCEDYYVIVPKENAWIQMDLEHITIQEAKK